MLSVRFKFVIVTLGTAFRLSSFRKLPFFCLKWMTKVGYFNLKFFDLFIRVWGLDFLHLYSQSLFITVFEVNFITATCLHPFNSTHLALAENNNIYNSLSHRKSSQLETIIQFKSLYRQSRYLMSNFWKTPAKMGIMLFKKVLDLLVTMQHQMQRIYSVKIWICQELNSGIQPKKEIEWPMFAIKTTLQQERERLLSKKV